MTPNLRPGSVKPTRVVNRQMNQIGHKTSTQCICREEKGNQLYEIIMFLQRIVKFLHPKVFLLIVFNYFNFDKKGD